MQSMATTTSTAPRDGTALANGDPYLEPFRSQLRERHSYLESILHNIDEQGGLLGPISQGHKYFGFNRGELWGKPGVWYREWAPGAIQLRLIGDFNHWDRFGNPMVCDQFGV